MNTKRTPGLLMVAAGHLLLLWALLQMAPHPQAQRGTAWRVVEARLLGVAPAPAQDQQRRPAAQVHRPLGRHAAVLPSPSMLSSVSAATAAPITTAATPEPAPQFVAIPATLTAEERGAIAPPPLVLAAPAPAPTLVAARADHAHCTPAAHPAALRERGIEGVVRLRVQVAADGRATEVRLMETSGWRLFDEAALQQARGCRFIPAQRGGLAIDSWVEFPVRFALAG